jgi:hypothetical protein
MEINKIKKAAEIAKARTNDKRWHSAIDKAVAGVESDDLVVTILSNRALVTSPNGSYVVTDHCQCAAARNGKSVCYHRAAVRLAELSETLPEPTKRQAPTITRSVERDYTGAKCVAVRCNGWLI